MGSVTVVAAGQRNAEAPCSWIGHATCVRHKVPDTRCSNRRDVKPLVLGL